MTTLNIEACDQIVRDASKAEFGAIEDAEVTAASVAYFFESGASATVDRRSGVVAVTS